jgi:hypothetical protein
MMVYKDGNEIDAHETQVEYYLRKGWSLEPNQVKIPAPVSPVVAAAEDAPESGDSEIETSNES